MHAHNLDDTIFGTKEVMSAANESLIPFVGSMEINQIEDQLNDKTVL
jgi:hypothetical protein